MDKLVSKAQVSPLGTSTWKEQFKDALTVVVGKCIVNYLGAVQVLRKRHGRAVVLDEIDQTLDSRLGTILQVPPPCKIKKKFFSSKF